ncbi:tRNA-(ms[2]io[6]A)-hydroxylase [bacterium]|nr:tRNA-(ms[2]io[6]A)-hydroxylase [bacterium]
MEPTPHAWVEAVLANVPRVLGDHAHCELKAASTALSLMGRYADDLELVLDLCALAREEMRHFERVHQVLVSRGLRLPPVGPDDYVKELRRRAQRGLVGQVSLDALLICGFVEARSCERFRLLARSLRDEPLRAFYEELALAEARHHELFFSHASRRAGADAARARTAEIAAIEGDIVRSRKPSPRIH